MLLLLLFQKKVPKDIHHHHHHHHNIDGADSVTCFGSTVVLKISSYEFENAAMKGVKTYLSIGKKCGMKLD